MTNQFEKQLVEDYVIEKLKESGWQFIPADQLQRPSLSEPILEENLKKQVIKINKNLNIGEEELKKVINELKLLTTGQDGNKRLLDFLKYGVGVKFEKERVVKIINLFDFENIENNEFIVTRQIHFRGKDIIVPDIILYVNGIPLVDIECKNLLSLKTDWTEGYKQIKNYEKLMPELYKYIQIGVSFTEKVRYFPIVPWQDEVTTYLWKKDELKEDEAIFEMLNPLNLLDIIRNFLFIREEHSEIKKVIARYVQYRAVNKIYKRVIDNLNGIDEKNKGLIWHWQGSGKTLTMIFATHKLYFDKKLENPTIFIIIDRRDLEEQMNQELSSLRLNFKFDLINNVFQLKKVVSADNYLGKRGVFLTLIYKFRADEKFLPSEIPNSIASRKNVICFLDEVHRSQYGLLAAQMKSILKNGFYFGFTGTPIAENERNTYEEFGYPLKEEGYLDKYFLDDSQKDGFTLPLIYQLKREKGLNIDQEKIKYFLKKDDLEEIDFDSKEIDKKTQEELNEAKVFLENENRIKAVAYDIVNHFKENVDGRFKGMVVCASRKACVLYKKYLDLYLPESYSEVVMTFNLNDQEPISSFYKKWQERYQGFADDEKRIKNIIENYKEKELPKILIVTDMLITGFDAPILQTIYFDKLLKKHRLLQAIARVNRPYKDLKSVGLIIDYVGIIKNINEALKNYFKDDIKGGIVDISVVFEEFKISINKLKEVFKNIELKITRENLTKAIEILQNEETKNYFIETYKKIRKLFELLGALPQKLEYLDDYQWFTALYQYWLKLTSFDEDDFSKKFFKKTLSIIHQNTQIQQIENLIPPIALNVDYLYKIRDGELTKQEKAVNILFALEKLVLVEQKHNPAYMNLVDKINELIKQWKERKIDYIKLFDEESKIIIAIKSNEEKRKILNLNKFDYGMFVILKRLIKENDEILKEITEKIKSFIKDDLVENWQENPILRQNIERKTREYLLEIKLKYNLTYEEFDLLHQELIKFIQDYGYRPN